MASRDLRFSFGPGFSGRPPATLHLPPLLAAAPRRPSGKGARRRGGRIGDDDPGAQIIVGIMRIRRLWDKMSAKPLPLGPPVIPVIQMTPLIHFFPGCLRSVRGEMKRRLKPWPQPPVGRRERAHTSLEN